MATYKVIKPINFGSGAFPSEKKGDIDYVQNYAPKVGDVIELGELTTSPAPPHHSGYLFKIKSKNGIFAQDFINADNVEKVGSLGAATPPVEKQKLSPTEIAKNVEAGKQEHRYDYLTLLNPKTYLKEPADYGILVGGLVAAYGLGRYGKTKGGTVVTIGYGLSGFLLGCAATDVAARGVGIKQNKGWGDGMEIGIFWNGWACCFRRNYWRQLFLW